nr:MAG TPA: hypothetical protein [Caudoviricetes sp.]
MYILFSLYNMIYFRSNVIKYMSLVVIKVEVRSLVRAKVK